MLCLSTGRGAVWRCIGRAGHRSGVGGWRRQRRCTGLRVSICRSVQLSIRFLLRYAFSGADKAALMAVVVLIRGFSGSIRSWHGRPSRLLQSPLASRDEPVLQARIGGWESENGIYVRDRGSEVLARRAWCLYACLTVLCGGRDSVVRKA